MSLPSVIQALIAVPAITSIVGPNCAMVQLPQQAGYPALVYEPMSGVPILPINASSGQQLVEARVTFTALARQLSDVEAIQTAVRAAIEYQRGMIGGTRVTSIVRILTGAFTSDVESKVFAQPVDYRFTFYE